MNAAYLHLILNHIPVLGVPFGLALLASAVFWRNETLRRAGWVTLVVVALVTVPVYLAGEGAEEIVEHEPGVSHDTIEEHEEIALVAVIAMEALGVLSLAGLLLSRRAAGAPSWMGLGSLGLAVVVAGLMGLTAYRGGKINHPEAHGGAGVVDGDDAEGREREDDHGGGRRRRGRH
jgi:uncharacterized membrane protein